jgi:tetratricopeptide (TPR) repeat protein
MHYANVFVMLWLILVIPAIPAAAAETYPLAALVERALSRSDWVAALEARVEEKRVAAEQALAWQNPQLGIAVGRKQVASLRGPAYEAAISQPFFSPGKQALRAQMLDLGAEGERVRVRHASLFTSSEVVRLAYEYAANRRKTKFAKERLQRFELIRGYLAGRAIWWNAIQAYPDPGAVRAAHRGFAIRERALGLEHPDLAASLDSVAAGYEATHEYERAEALYRRALAIREKALGPEHPEVAGSLGHLAFLFCLRGTAAHAGWFYRQALAIQEKALGPDHPAVASTLNDLAFLHYLQGEGAEAQANERQPPAVHRRLLPRPDSDPRAATQHLRSPARDRFRRQAAEVWPRVGVQRRDVAQSPRQDLLDEAAAHPVHRIHDDAGVRAPDQRQVNERVDPLQIQRHHVHGFHHPRRQRLVIGQPLHGMLPDPPLEVRRRRRSSLERSAVAEIRLERRRLVRKHHRRDYTPRRYSLAK